MKKPKVTALANEHCLVGENPLWRQETGEVFWTDILSNRVYCYATASQAHRTVYDGDQMVGGFTFQADGSLLLFRETDVARLGADGSVEPLFAFEDEGTFRCNDVIADPEGRVFAGRMSKDTTSGGLYRVDLDGRATNLFRESPTPNGMGFTPDLSGFYYTCSKSKRIFKFDYDRASGEISNRRLLYEATEDEGTPDGMTVDAEGNLWSARWGGYCIVKHDGRDGSVLDRLTLPVEKVSSAVFGGPAWDTLYVTTAGGDRESGSADGTLYAVRMPVTGKPEFESKIMLCPD